MEIVFLDRGTKEWDYAWAKLAKLPLNQDNQEPMVCHNSTYGESWQYMCTVETKTLLSFSPGVTLPAMVHQFRHRAHPLDNQRKYVNIPVSEEYLGVEA